MAGRGDESLNHRGTIPNIHGHMPALDGVRGLAILLVIFHHAVILRPTGPLEEIVALMADLGKHGVDLFFVLSGFLITGILLDSRGQPGFFRNFYARRTLRIFPLYYAVLFFFLVLVPAVMALNPETLSGARKWNAAARHWPWYVGYVPNLLFVKNNAFGPYGLDVTWSLGIEEQFYLVWAVTVFFLKPRPLARACLFLVVLSFAVRCVLHWNGASWIQVYVNTLSRMDALALGALPAALMRSPGFDRRRFLNLSGWAAAVAASVLIFLIPRWLLAGESRVQLTIGLPLVAVTSAGGIVHVLHAPEDHPARVFFQSRWLGFVGKYSYAMYLFHVPVRDALRRHIFTDDVIQRLSGTSLIGLQALFFAVAAIGTVIPAVLSWHLFEKHWLSLKRFFPSHHKQVGVVRSADPTDRPKT